MLENDALRRPLFPGRLMSRDAFARCVASRIRPLTAVGAFCRLAKTGGADVAQAMIFIRATEGRSGQRAFARFRETPVGRRVLREQRSLVRPLSDDAVLAGFPPGTLRQVFHAFLMEAGVSVAALMAFTARPRFRRMTADEQLFEDRISAQHDLLHVVLGYHTDHFGEVACWRCGSPSTVISAFGSC